MYFSYNGTRDWLKIEWRDQSCMKPEVSSKLAKNKDSKICLRFETGLHRRVFFSANSFFALSDLRESTAYATSFPGLFP